MTERFRTNDAGVAKYLKTPQGKKDFKALKKGATELIKPARRILQHSDQYRRMQA